MFKVAVWASDGSEHCFSFTEREENSLSVRKPRSIRRDVPAMASVPRGR